VHSQEQEHRRSGVARVVESAIPYSRSLEQLLPVVSVSTRVQRSTNLIAKDPPPFVNRQLSGRPSLDRLGFSVVPKQVEHRFRQWDHPAASTRLSRVDIWPREHPIGAVTGVLVAAVGLRSVFITGSSSTALDRQDCS
jgi:hypothetical protein